MKCLAQTNNKGYLYCYNPKDKRDIRLAAQIIEHCFRKNIRFRMVEQERRKAA